MRINLFGNLRIEVAGKPVTSVNTNRLQSLLAYLILNGDTPQPRDRLAFTLWPASRESQARTNLRQLVHSLKRALPAECDSLMIDHFALQWRHDVSCTVDVVEFQAALREAAAAQSDDDRAREMQRLKAAAKLYEDDILPTLYDDWLLTLREQYRKKICDALCRIATLLEEQKDYAAAISYAERLLILDSLSEPHHQLLIRLHAANNDRASALRAYHQCMRVLRREMGVEPDPATKGLFERILKGDADRPGERISGPAAVAAAKPFSVLQKARAIVGRTAEWGLLLQAWQTAIEEGPRVAVISGEPGIGKTRLADELYQSCVRQGYAAARSRCYAGQGQPAYAAVAEWLRSDVVRTGWTKLRRQQLAELARLIPEVGEQFPDLEIAKSGEAKALPENWQRLLFYDCLSAAIAKSRKPILLYLDDMQWCDPDSLEWLNAFLISPAAAGVLVLGTVRAEETGREHPFTRFLARLRSSAIATEISLGHLNAQETAELARRESTKPLESGNLAEIFRVTRGNPLFIVETVRSGSQSTRVHAVITARLGQLTASAYEMAGLASVVGRPFSFELLAKAIDWDERSVSGALEELWQRRIIESRGASEYDLSHDLVREVAYSELSLVRKRYLHRGVARALAEVYSSEIESWSGQIASHFEHAGMAEDAIEWFRCAAADARRQFADTEAADLLKRALTLCRNFPDSERKLKQELDLRKMCGIVWCYQGSIEQANTILDPIRSYCPPAFELLVPMPFPMLQGMFDGIYPAGLQWYWKADFFREISDAAIDKHIEYGSLLPTWQSTMHLYPVNGKVNRVGPSDTAFSYRDVVWSEVIIGVDPDPTNRNKITDWARAYYDALHPLGAGGAYLNFMMEEGEDRIRATYRGNYTRLAAIKAKYDPENFFRVNQNIRPAG